MTDIERQDFEDDSSTSLDLPHGSGGIQKFFDKQAEEHKQAMAAEMRRQKVQDPSKLELRNHEAYGEIELRVLHHQAQGLSLAESVTKAREDAENGIPLPPSDRETLRKAHKDYMGGVSTEELMDLHKPISKGGSKSSGRYGSKKPKRVKPYAQIEDEPRIYMAVARTSESNARSLNRLREKEGLNSAAILAAVAIIYEGGGDESDSLILLLQSYAPSRDKGVSFETKI